MSEDKPNSLLPYGVSPSAPPMEIPDRDRFHSERGAQAQNFISEKARALQAEIEKLEALAQKTALVYNADYSFIPKVGKVYHLYVIKDRYMLSLIEPHEWDREHIGSFRFTADATWEEIDE